MGGGGGGFTHPPLLGQGVSQKHLGRARINRFYYSTILLAFLWILGSIIQKLWGEIALGILAQWKKV